VVRVDLPLDPVLPEGQITDEALDALRGMIGVTLRPERFIREATVDTISNYCNGIGDQNPLHRSMDYSIWTRYGRLVAPYSFLYAVCWPGRTRYGLPGVHGFLAGNDVTFLRRVRLGESIRVVERVIGVEEKDSRMSGRMVMCRVESTFLDDRGQTIARCIGWNTRHERSQARDRIPDVPLASYTDSELATIEDAQYAEADSLIGGRSRYWEDVNVGDKTAVLVRGPLSLSDINAFLVGCGRGVAHGLAIRAARRHPDHYFRNPAAGGALEYTGMGHHIEAIARAVGVPRSYDYGPQRLAWLGTCVEGWMGDDGHLIRLRGDLRAFNLLGDTLWIHGTVKGKHHDDAGRPVVELDMHAVNQREEVSMRGQATIQLPTRSLDNRTRL